MSTGGFPYPRCSMYGQMFHVWHIKTSSWGFFRANVGKDSIQICIIFWVSYTYGHLSFSAINEAFSLSKISPKKLRETHLAGGSRSRNPPRRWPRPAMRNGADVVPVRKMFLGDCKQIIPQLWPFISYNLSEKNKSFGQGWTRYSYGHGYQL